MKFPYGICDFHKIVTKGYFYCDRTDRSSLLERGEYLLFLRPRRFGKSLLLSTLFNYYDVAKKDEFDTLFGHLKIGKHPPPLHNRYFVLQWDFSCVESYRDVGQIRRSLHDHINSCIKDFRVYYREFLNAEIEVDPQNAVNSVKSLVTAVRTTDYPVYLLIDEYDNFANEVMMGVRREKQNIYEGLVYEEGPLRTIFKAVKSSTKESLFDRIFITGVSPVVMNDIASGYNIADALYIMDSESETDRRYADLTMIIRPDMRKYKILDILIEFKFVKLKEVGLSGEQARKLTTEEPRALPQMTAEMADASAQVKDYGEVLEKRYGNLRLRKYAAVSLGFERIWWKEC